MSSFRINFNEVVALEAMPAGMYPIRVNEVILRESTTTPGSYYLNWELVVTLPGEFDGRKTYLMTSLKPNALWRLKTILQNLGLEPGDMNLNVDEETGIVLEPDFRNLVGLAKVVVEEYQGVKRDRAEDIQPVQSDVFTPIGIATPKVNGTTPVVKPQTQSTARRIV